MILERKSLPNIEEINSNLGKYMMQGTVKDNIQDTLHDLIKMQHLYNSAIKEVSTKLEIIAEELEMMQEHNPIHHIETRQKSMRSVAAKMANKGLALDIKKVREHILDIAGIRVICNYTEDVYSMAEILLNQRDIELIERKDYIQKPKESGYRSLHLTIAVPIYLSDTVEKVPVEIQLRTTAMDFWASLEHKLRYKSNNDLGTHLKEQLKECALQLAEIETKMQSIHEELKSME